MDRWKATFFFAGIESFKFAVEAGLWQLKRFNVGMYLLHLPVRWQLVGDSPTLPQDENEILVFHTIVQIKYSQALHPHSFPKSHSLLNQAINR